MRCPQSPMLRGEEEKTEHWRRRSLDRVLAEPFLQGYERRIRRRGFVCSQRELVDNGMGNARLLAYLLPLVTPLREIVLDAVQQVGFVHRSPTL